MSRLYQRFGGRLCHGVRSFEQYLQLLVSNGCPEFAYQTTRNAEDYADEILSQPNEVDVVGQRFQGGSMASDDFNKA